MSETGVFVITIGLSNQPVPPSTPGIFPKSGGILFYLAAEALDVPDTLSNRTADFFFSSLLAHTSFSDPNGQSIGLGYDTVVDTTYWICEMRDSISQNCLSWAAATGTSYDTLTMDTALLPNHNLISFEMGSVTITSSTLPSCCSVPGDADGSGDVNIGDATFLVRYIFQDGDAPACLDQADTDGSNDVNISDAIYIVKYAFEEGAPAPVCAVVSPVCP